MHIAVTTAKCRIYVANASKIRSLWWVCNHRSSSPIDLIFSESVQNRYRNLAPAFPVPKLKTPFKNGQNPRFFSLFLNFEPPIFWRWRGKANMLDVYHLSSCFDRSQYLPRILSWIANQLFTCEIWILLYKRVYVGDEEGGGEYFNALQDVIYSIWFNTLALRTDPCNKLIFYPVK